MNLGGQGGEAGSLETMDQGRPRRVRQGNWGDQKSPWGQRDQGVRGGTGMTRGVRGDWRDEGSPRGHWHN